MIFRKPFEHREHIMRKLFLAKRKLNIYESVINFLWIRWKILDSHPGRNKICMKGVDIIRNVFSLESERNLSEKSIKAFHEKLCKFNMNRFFKIKNENFNEINDRKKQ